MNLKGKDFLKLLDFTPEEIGYLIDRAAELKAQKKAQLAWELFRRRGALLIHRRESLQYRW